MCTVAEDSSSFLEFLPRQLVQGSVPVNILILTLAVGAMIVYIAQFINLAARGLLRPVAAALQQAPASVVAQSASQEIAPFDWTPILAAAQNLNLRDQIFDWTPILAAATRQNNRRFATTPEGEDEKFVS